MWETKTDGSSMSYRGALQALLWLRLRGILGIN